MATTSLPLATAAAMATILSAPSGATPADPSPVPSTPARPGATNDAPAPNNSAPQQDNAAPQQQRANVPQPGVTTPPPGVNTPTPNTPTLDQNAPNLVQPGVTSPRVAPLPLPGQSGQDKLAAVPDHNPLKQPNDAQPEQPRWNSPSLQAAPAAPVVQMNGPHTEVGANVDGGSVLPGYVANTHHFSNLDGYVGTVGYRTPTGTGDAGLSVEFVGANRIKVTTYTHTTGIDDLKSATGFNDVTNETYIDTTQANLAKAAVESWVRQQPGGAAALEAAAQIGKLPEGELAPQTVNIAGVTTQWGGSVQY